MNKKLTTLFMDLSAIFLFSWLILFSYILYIIDILIFLLKFIPNIVVNFAVALFLLSFVYSFFRDLFFFDDTKYKDFTKDNILSFLFLLWFFFALSLLIFKANFINNIFTELLPYYLVIFFIFLLAFSLFSLFSIREKGQSIKKRDLKIYNVSLAPWGILFVSLFYVAFYLLISVNDLSIGKNTFELFFFIGVFILDLIAMIWLLEKKNSVYHFLLGSPKDGPYKYEFINTPLSEEDRNDIIDRLLIRRTSIICGLINLISVIFSIRLLILVILI